MSWYIECWKKFGDFGGRARRREYWFFTLFNFLFAIGLLVIDVSTGLFNEQTGLSPLYTLYSLATIIPGLAVTVRRLHDTNHSGWSMLIAILPIIGPIILLVWLARDSDPGKNAYGPNPKRNQNSWDAEDDFAKPPREFVDL